MFRSQQIIIREYVCTSLKLLNYFKNSEFKILKIILGVVAAKRVAGIELYMFRTGFLSIRSLVLYKQQ